MMSRANTRVVMRRHPNGMVTEADFAIEHGTAPEPAEGQALVQVKYLSLDPYMRPMMDPVRSYVPHLNPGQLMPGATIAEVVETRDPGLPVGTTVACALGWQEYGLVSAADVRIVDPEAGPISAALSVLGMPGVTAHYGLLELTEPKAGETVVVTAASGAVGSVVGQLAKLKGARVVGIAGGPEKCAYVVGELGFDSCIDYRSATFEEQLAEATPDYVDVLFENVGGPIFDAVLGRVNDHARVALCGNISQYNADEPYGLKGVRQLLMHRVTVHAFVIADHRGYWPRALPELSGWLADGSIRYREDVASGLVDAPKAFIGMLTGLNFGKQLVEVSAD
ncbi:MULTISPECIES: NADP-dependent oxidoreductase [Rhodococcus]|nr:MULTISPECIES: NADP-dependent oxidoreductase [Rhodococcus]